MDKDEPECFNMLQEKKDKLENYVVMKEEKEKHKKERTEEKQKMCITIILVISFYRISKDAVLTSE
jgi:hypothetical protein